MLATLYTTPADTLEVNDYVRFTHDGEDYEGAVLAVDDNAETVFLSLANEGDYGDRVEVEVPWDLDIPVLAQDYSDVEV